MCGREGVVLREVLALHWLPMLVAVLCDIDSCSGTKHKRSASRQCQAGGLVLVAVTQAARSPHESVQERWASAGDSKR